MDATSVIDMDKAEAIERLRELRKIPEEERTWIDRDMAAALRALAKGKSIVDARILVMAGGVDDVGRPRLGLARADWTELFLEQWKGRITYQGSWSPNGNETRYALGDLFPEVTETPPLPRFASKVRTMVPPIPPRFRPRRWNLRNHLICFEVDEWAAAAAPPGVDPFLLKPVTGWLCTVEAKWNLTDLERTVMAGHALTP